MTDYASWFRETTPYISAHRGKTFVVSLCGAAIEHPNLRNIVHDVALLAVLGVRVVLVHGARPQFDAALPNSETRAGLRITHAEDLQTITATLAAIRVRLEGMFSAGLPGSPLHQTEINLVSGNFVVARPLGVMDGVDHAHTGRVRSLRRAAIDAELSRGAIVLLPPSGYSRSGALYNLAAEELAADAAVALEADKLITFASDAFIADADGRALPELTPIQMEQVIASLPDDHPDRRRLSAMLSANRRGVPRCQQVSYVDDGALLAELFTADGQGSQLSQSPYRNVRAALDADLPAIIALTRPLEAQGVLVARSRAQIERDLDRYLVAEVDGAVVGCCAAVPFDDAVELACLASHPLQRNSRAPVGDQLLAATERRARDLGSAKVFALTTAAPDWFLERGFTLGEPGDLPAPRAERYDADRGSYVLIKAL